MAGSVVTANTYVRQGRCEAIACLGAGFFCTVLRVDARNGGDMLTGVVPVMPLLIGSTWHKFFVVCVCPVPQISR
jgi:hypothetical protein